MERLTLPQPANSLWKLTAQELHQLLDYLPGGRPVYRMGGDASGREGGLQAVHARPLQTCNRKLRGLGIHCKNVMETVSPSRRGHGGRNGPDKQHRQNFRTSLEDPG